MSPEESSVQPRRSDVPYNVMVNGLVFLVPPHVRLHHLYYRGLRVSHLFILLLMSCRRGADETVRPVILEP
jgi:hypothetical protein